MNAKRTGLLTSATAILASIVLAAPASAISWDHTGTTEDFNPGGKLKFKVHGDIVQVCDVNRDGYSAEVEVASRYRVYYTLNASGKGECATARATKGDKYNLKETREYKHRFRVYLRKNDRAYYRNTYRWYNNR